MLAFETPVLIVALTLEFAISLYKKKKLFALDDSINSITCGMINVCFKIFVKWISMIPYAYIYRKFSLSYFDPSSLWSCLVVFLAVDLVYYWMHREMHMINIGWAGHATHHSSEYLNLTTAIRQSAFGQLLGWIFFLPLAFFFPPQLYTLHYSINLFIQIWIHTELIGKTHPAIEFIFNTPSHHRVHHARNPEYLDKNFGGALIIWDRIFGTFAEEQTTPIYGLVHPLRTWDVFWAQVHHLVYIYEEASKYSLWRNKIAVTFAPPGWTISEKTNSWIAPDTVPVDPTEPRYKTELPSKLTVYLVVRFVLTIVVFNVVVANKFQFWESLLLCVYITFCLETYGLILNKSVYAYTAEFTRIGFELLVTAYFLRHTTLAQSTLFQIGISTGSLVYLLSVSWLISLRDQFSATLKVKELSEPSKQLSEPIKQMVVGAGNQ